MVTFESLAKPSAPGVLRSALELRQALRQTKFAWVDLANPSSEEVALLHEVFHFHRLSIEDCTDDLHYPKLEQFPAYLFVILHALDSVGEREFHTSEIDFFITRKVLVTFHRKPSSALALVGQRLRTGGFKLPLTPDVLFQSLASHLVDEYFPLLDVLDDEIDGIEDAVFKAPERAISSGSSVTSRFLVAKKRLTSLKRMLAPQREVFSRLSHGPFPEVAAETTVYLRDVYDRLFRITELLDSFRDVLSSTLEAYLSVVSNRLNEVMKVLTIVTVIILPLTLIAGIYGMNFRHLPELGWYWGYPMALGLMVIVAGGLVWYFRRRRWL